MEKNHKFQIHEKTLQKSISWVVQKRVYLWTYYFHHNGHKMVFHLWLFEFVKKRYNHPGKQNGDVPKKQ